MELQFIAVGTGVAPDEPPPDEPPRPAITQIVPPKAHVAARGRRAKFIEANAALHALEAVEAAHETEEATTKLRVQVQHVPTSVELAACQDDDLANCYD